MNYHYDQHVYAELELVIQAAIPQTTRLRLASKEQDVGGIDATYEIDATQCPLQIRVRFNRPHDAADVDVTLRETEPRMIERKTYAPLFLVVWFEQGYPVAGRLVDVYRMANHAIPRLHERPLTPNKDRRHGFLGVPIWELVRYGSLLRIGDRSRNWVDARYRGADIARGIVDAHNGR